MEVIGEMKYGLASKITMKCKMCNLKGVISTEDPEKEKDYMNVNLAAVSGMMATGGGYSQLQELCASFDMPVMTKSTWNTSQEKVRGKNINVHVIICCADLPQNYIGLYCRST